MSCVFKCRTVDFIILWLTGKPNPMYLIDQLKKITYAKTA